MRPTGAIAAVALTMATAACSASTSADAVFTGAASNPAGTPSTSAAVTTGTSTGTPPPATVIGRFRIAGGPYPGTPHPIDGTIAVHAGSSTGKVVTTVHTLRGRFTVTLSPGRYSFVGRSGELTGGGPGCPTYKPVPVTSGQVAHVIVQCDVP